MRRLLLASIGSLAIAFTTPAHAEIVDRVVVRLISPETGGAAHPRFFTEREVAFFTRVEATIELSDGSEYQERYVRAAVDRLVARSMLASLLVQRGVEPPELRRQAEEARAELETRLGGPQMLIEALKKEHLDDDELLSFLEDEVRAAHYVDRAISPILAVTEDSLRETFRSAIHPFRGAKFDEIRPRLKRWLVTERLRAAELEFLQGARARIKVTPIAAPPSTVPAK